MSDCKFRLPLKLFDLFAGFVPVEFLMQFDDLADNNQGGCPHVIALNEFGSCVQVAYKDPLYRRGPFFYQSGRGRISTAVSF